MSSSKIFWYASVSSGSPALSRFTFPVFFAPPPVVAVPPPALVLSSSSPHAAPMSTSAMSTTIHRRNRILDPLLWVWAWPDLPGCFVDPRSVYGIEEVRAVRVEHELDPLPLARLR